MIREAIGIVTDGRSLHREQAAQVMREILLGEATPAQFGALMVALRLKGETPEELSGFASTMRAHVMPVVAPAHVVDTCGTGGDGQHTFNISTIAALVVAASGQPVAKHGNRAASSMCGSADVLEALGVKIQLSPVEVAQSIRDTGFGFMFANLYHPSMKFAGPLRREIGVRTAFNLLGPLTNPAGARHQLLGAPDKVSASKIAQALALLGTDHTLVVCGGGRMDEFSLSDATDVWEVRGDQVQEYQVVPEQFGLTVQPADALRGGDVQTNAGIARDVLAGKPGAPLDVVVLSAGAALYAAGAVSSIMNGIEVARESVHSGHAAATLEKLAANGDGR